MAHRVDFGDLYEVLRRFDGRFSKFCTGTIIRAEQFGNHFAAVSEERYGNHLERIAGAKSVITDGSTEEELQKPKFWFNRPLSFEEVFEAMNEVKVSTPGKDRMRMRYIKAATTEIQTNVVEMVQKLFKTRANNWSESLKIGDVVHTHKKVDQNDCNTYRDVCFLALANRILALVAAKRLRTWTEQYRILDDIPSGNGFGQAGPRPMQRILSNESKKTLKIWGSGGKQLISR